MFENDPFLEHMHSKFSKSTDIFRKMFSAKTFTKSAKSVKICGKFGMNLIKKRNLHFHAFGKN
jgi:hypothetical protein